MADFQIAPQAREDLKEIYRYIAQENRQAARRVLSTMREKFGMLGRQPLIGEMRDELLPELRSFPAGNYVVFYIPRDGGVRITRVLHGARDIESLF